MAVINVRVDDRIRDELKVLADAEGVSLSEFIRILLIEAIVPVRDAEEHEEAAKHGDAAAPDSFRLIDRQMLSLLHRILGRVLPEGAGDVDGDLAYQLERAHVLEEGYVGEYWKEVSGFATELSRRDCRRVNDILQMFQVVRFSLKSLADAGTPLDDRRTRYLEFDGFDFNDSLEGHMGSYVGYMVSSGRWSDLKPILAANDGGNSHSPTLPSYTLSLIHI